MSIPGGDRCITLPPLDMTATSMFNCGAKMARSNLLQPRIANMTLPRSNWAQIWRAYLSRKYNSKCSPARPEYSLARRDPPRGFYKWPTTPERGGYRPPGFAGYLFIATMISILLAGFGSWLVLGRVLAPLGAATETALAINRADDLSRRIPYEGVSSDEIGNLIEAFNQTLERLENLFNSQQRFLADVSHELRTPLTVIKGNVDLMRRMKQFDEESLSSIDEEAGRLTRLVVGLLLLTQADSGKLILSKQPVELDTLLLEVFHEMRILAGNKVHLKIADIDQILFHGDRDRLKQVLLNLVANAIQYTPQGGDVIMGLRAYQRPGAHHRPRYRAGHLQ